MSWWIVERIHRLGGYVEAHTVEAAVLAGLLGAMIVAPLGVISGEVPTDDFVLELLSSWLIMSVLVGAVCWLLKRWIPPQVETPDSIRQMLIALIFSSGSNE